MKTAIIQMDISWQDCDNNLRHAGKLIDSLPDADLYLLPEMFTSGFSMKPSEITDSKGLVLRWMQGKATELGAAICGTTAVEDDGKFYNRMYFVKPGGAVEIYDKRHLFTYSGENRCYSAGEKRVVVEWLGVRILLQTCYDLRFPVFSRNLSDYDMAVYLACWPESRHDAWTTLLKARALENQCYVAGVNRSGDDPFCHYKGGSRVIDPYGKCIAECSDHIESCACTFIDMEQLKAYRKKFPVLEDGDLKCVDFISSKVVKP